MLPFSYKEYHSPYELINQGHGQIIATRFVWVKAASFSNVTSVLINIATITPDIWFACILLR
jgi:hypothetical protein